MRRVLIVGDAIVPTGFAKLNHAYIAGLQRAGYDVHALALNYMGDPHDQNFKAYPTFTWTGGDGFGMTRLRELIPKLKPDVIVVTNDPWNLGAYKEYCADAPLVANVAVDGKNCRGTELNGYAKAIFWTEFGRREANAGGYTGPSSVIPLGVDLNTYFPIGQREARKSLLPARIHEAFIVGVVGRNQPRKRIDLAMYYFSEWMKRFKHEDAFLFLQVAPTGDSGYDLPQLAHYLGIAGRIIISTKNELGMGITEEKLRTVYNCFDVQLATTQGEGWGLTHMEAMACRVAQIVPAWAALDEWMEDAAIKIPCSGIACTPNDINAVGGIADQEKTIAALESVYQGRELLEYYAQRGLELVSRPEFRWESIGDRFAEEVTAVFAPKELTTSEIHAQV